jgi:hypothetical protein
MPWNKTKFLFSFPILQSTIWLSVQQGIRKYCVPVQLVSYIHTNICTFWSNCYHRVGRKQVNGKKDTHITVISFILRNKSTQKYYFWTEVQGWPTYNFIMGGNYDHLADSCNILNKLEILPSAIEHVILTLWRRSCFLNFCTPCI